MDSIKQWLLNVGVKQFGPSFIRGIILVVVGWLAAHNGMLSGLGIIYDSTAHVLTINFDSLQAWAGTAGITALTAGLIKILNYHATQVVSKETPPS